MTAPAPAGPPPVHVPYARTGAEPDVVSAPPMRAPAPPRPLAVLGGSPLASLARGDHRRGRRGRRHGVLGAARAPAHRRGHHRARGRRPRAHEHDQVRRAAVERRRMGVRARLPGRVRLPHRKREPRRRLEHEAWRRPVRPQVEPDGAPPGEAYLGRGRRGFRVAAKRQMSRSAPRSRRGRCGGRASGPARRPLVHRDENRALGPVVDRFQHRCEHLPALRKSLGKRQ